MLAITVFVIANIALFRAISRVNQIHFRANHPKNVLVFFIPLFFNKMCLAFSILSDKVVDITLGGGIICLR